jgi:mannose-1-phosphate guanylyltransferase / mannose-6-phosphate isomerase
VVVAVVLCGGVGKRLWPLSTQDLPKPFHALTGELSLLQNTLLRCVGEPFQEPVYIVTHERYASVARAQAAAVGVEVFLVLERQSHDSCAAALAGAGVVSRREPKATLAIVAADQHVPDHASWRNAVRQAAVAQYDGFVLFGIVPDQPSTSYGYVAGAAPCPKTGLRQVLHFIEKPNAERAKSYLAKGWMWNSGNFIVPAQTVLNVAAKTVPAMASDIAIAVNHGKKTKDALTLHDIGIGDWAPLSLDKAILEYTDDIAVLPVDFRWSDVGTWDEVQRLNGNGQFVHSTGLDVRVIGLDDVIVVATPQGILVTRQGYSDDLKRAVK